MLITEELASATVPRLHFIDHEQPALIVAKGSQPLQVRLVRDLNAAFALNGLDKYSNDILVVGSGLLNRL